ncbi:hypothetical protein HQ489_04175, partial [Candidatus Woesearchaeota archaeon]|nr:hypothetical protein [Candidatus Woesearchaeota archaeon]
RNIAQSNNWAQPLMTEDSLDMLISHVPPTNGKGVTRESSVQNLKNLLFQRRERGLKSPKVIMSGHLHTSTSVGYNEELDALWIQPGTAGYNHNEGDHSSFVIVNTNDQTKDVESVEEHRIYNKDDGSQEVEHYGTHKIDLSQKKLEDRVNFKDVRKVVIDAHQKDYKDFRTMDVNHRLLKEGIRLDYDSFKSAEEKEEALINNFSLLQVYTDRVKTTIKDVIETERRELAKEKGNEELKDFQLDGLRKNIYLKLSDIAAKMFHTTYEELHAIDATINENVHRDNMLFRAYGIREHDINKFVTIEESAKVDDFKYSFGAELTNKAMQATSNSWQNKILSRLGPKDFQEMAELHLSQKVKRTRDMRNKKEALDFWAKSNQQGLITSQDALKTSMYEEKEGYMSKERSEDDLYKLLDAQDIQKKIRNMPDSKTAQKRRDEETKEIKKREKEELIENLQRKYKNESPIFIDTRGNFVFTQDQNGQLKRDYEFNQQIPENYKLSDIIDEIDYTPKRLETLLKDKKALLFNNSNNLRYLGILKDGRIEGRIPLEKSDNIDYSKFETYKETQEGPLINYKREN